MAFANGNGLEAPLVEKSVSAKSSPSRSAFKTVSLSWERVVPRGRSVDIFKFNVRLATRTAVWCALYALPSFLPHLIRDSNYLGMVSSGVTFIVFTVYQNLGATIRLALQGFIGTTLACLYTHVMNVIMPLGARGEYYHPWLAHTMIISFVVLVLWLNISKNCTMFLLCYHCYFAMEFVNPNSTTIFNTSWAVDYDAYTTTTFVTATLGILAAVLATMLPTPILATQSCRSDAMRSVTALTALIKELVDYFDGTEASVKIHRLEAVVGSLGNITESLKNDLDGTWWEAFFLAGVTRRVRKHLQRHVQLMLRMGDNVAALQVCVAKEDFGPTHAECMNGIRTEVTKLVSTTQVLLEASVKAANDGFISESEKAQLHGEATKAKEAARQLTTAFHVLRRRISPHKAVSPDLQSEYFFVYCLTVYTRYAVDYAEDLIARQVKVMRLRNGLRQKLFSLIDPKIILWDKNYRSFVLRNSLSVIINFYIGMFLLGYSGIAAGTCALLLSNYAGSAMQKNLGRLQGVVVGNVIPHIVVQLFGTFCSTRTTVIRMVSLVLWEIFANYIYYGSQAYGYIGCLAAAFGASVLVTPCSIWSTTKREDAAFEASFQHSAFQKIHETAIATIVMTLVDSVLAPKRASTMANDAIMEVLTTIDAGIIACFHKRNGDGTTFGGPIASRHEATGKQVFDIAHRRPGHILGLINEGASLVEEADKEPRFIRSPFQTKFFDDLFRIAKFLRANLSELEHVLKGSDELYDDILTDLRPLPSFRLVQAEIMKALDAVITITEDVINNETGESRHALVETYLKRSSDGMLKNMPKLIQEVNEKGLTTGPDAETLEDDILCRISVVLMLFDTMFGHLSDMIKLGITAS